MSNQDFASRYPKSISLPDGDVVEIRLMTAAGRDAILAFSQGLPQQDLLFFARRSHTAGCG
jgi:hypothetical protein